MTDGLTVQNLTVRYGRAIALADVSLTVPPGTLVAVVGPNGAGKSSFLKGLLGLAPHQGQVWWRGRPLRQQRSRVAWVPQRSEVDWQYPISVGQTVLLGRVAALGWGRSPGPRDRALVTQALARVGLTGLAHRRLAELSGGQQQRVFLARALTAEAELFLLDEPFAAIDRPTVADLVGLCRELVDRGKTVVMSCHEEGTILQQCDRLLGLAGRVVVWGTPAEVDPHWLDSWGRSPSSVNGHQPLDITC
ncbi:MAG: metal ABC transporter ATP-binding protein [Pseudanabaenaceae cyanobacterium]